MNSKESLERISEELYSILPKSVREDLINPIKQDLEGFEKLKEYGYYDLLQQNENLIKEIKDEIELLIERRFNAYSCDNYEVYNVIDAIIEELKEVLYGIDASL